MDCCIITSKKDFIKFWSRSNQNFDKISGWDRGLTYKLQHYNMSDYPLIADLVYDDFKLKYHNVRLFKMFNLNYYYNKYYIVESFILNKQNTWDVLCTFLNTKERKLIRTKNSFLSPNNISNSIDGYFFNLTDMTVKLSSKLNNFNEILANYHKTMENL